MITDVTLPLPILHVPTARRRMSPVNRPKPGRPEGREPTRRDYGPVHRWQVTGVTRYEAAISLA